jgi:hypothetical protein
MASTIASLLTGGLFQGINGLIDRIKGKSPEDAAKLAELTEKYQELILSADIQSRQAQADVNKVEAASSSICSRLAPVHRLGMRIRPCHTVCDCPACHLDCRPL